MPQQQEFLYKFFVKINNQNVPQEFIDDLAEVVVDTGLYLPEMFTIQLNDPQLKWVDDERLALGKEVEISAQTAGEAGGQRGALMKGEITALEPAFSAEGATTLLLRGYNKSHRLHRGRKTRTFQRQTDSAIVQTIAAEVGLTPQVDATRIIYDHVLQNNQTNMEFLQTRAERIGYQVFAAEGKLYFKKGEASLGHGPELALGETLVNFRPSLAATHQTKKVTVRGWDAKLKQPITGEAAPDETMKQGGQSETGGAAAESAFRDQPEVTIVNRPVFTPDEATALAKGLVNDLSGEFILAEGECAGDPGLKPGYKITITGVGQRFSGQYFVTAATHIYNKEGYTTHFTISGRQPLTVSHLLETANGGEGSRGQVQGVAVGLVTNLNDPDNLGRVKVKYPWLGDDIESDWVKIAAPGAGAQRGLYYLPEVNDEVLVAFEHGDVHRPYIVGGLWNNQDKPPKPNNQATQQGTVNERIIQSRSGHLLILDDTSGQEKIVIRDKTNQNELVIDSAANSMTIKVNGDFTVEARGKITLNSLQDLSVDSKTNGTIKALNLTLEGSTKGTLKGATVGVEGSALAEVKAALVKLN
ncbi:MAG: VgrG-related protein [Chloroflexota bacterium]